jgi:hypothetical protein
MARYNGATARAKNTERLPDVRCSPWLRELVARSAVATGTTEAKWIRAALEHAGKLTLRRAKIPLRTIESERH